MKKLAIFIFSLALFMSPRLFAQMPTWNLSGALQRSFTQGADRVWYFMESEALVHDPAVYRLLTQYFAPCVRDALGCWGGIEDHPSVCPTCIESTSVAFNFTNRVVGGCSWEVCGQEIPGFLPHTARLFPSSERFSIVAWQSPVTGMVRVTARFAGRNGPLAISVIWSVDKGNQTLKSGRIGVGYEDRALASISNLRVAKDDVIYFVVDDSFWGYFGDTFSVDLQATITQVQ